MRIYQCEVGIICSKKQRGEARNASWKWKRRGGRERESGDLETAGLWRTEGEGQAPQIHSLPMRECKAEWLGVSCFLGLLLTVGGKKRE